VDPADLGDPASTTTYTLCVFDHTAGDSTLAGSYTVPPNASFWTESPSRIRYLDGSGSADGVTRMRGRASLVPGKSKMRLKARGPNFLPPDNFSPNEYFDGDPDVTVQLLSSEGACWSSEYAPGTFRKNNREFFKAVGP
jgi:hypothetical protein